MRSIWNNLHILVLALLLGSTVFSACKSKDKAEAPVESETIAEEAGTGADDTEVLEEELVFEVEGPRVEILGKGLDLSEGPDLAPQTLAGGETVQIYDGIHLVLDTETRAKLGWPIIADDPSTDFLNGELLAESKLAIESSNPDQRSVSLLQDAGTGRYALNAVELSDTGGEAASADAAGDLTLRAGNLVVNTSMAGTDFIFSHHPVSKDEAADEEAETDADTDDDTADNSSDADTDSEDADTEDAEASDSADENSDGDADGDSDEDTDADSDADETILDDAAKYVWVIVQEGEVRANALPVAVTSEGEDEASDEAAAEETASEGDEADSDSDLEGEDEEGPTSSILEAGQAGVFRLDDGELIMAIAVEGAAVEGWYGGLADGRWNTPLAEIPDQEEDKLVAELDDVFTKDLPSASAGTSASFVSDVPEITLGDCTMIRWSVTGALFVELDKQPVGDSGTREVCPKESATYELHWVGLNDANDYNAYVSILVEDPQAAALGLESKKPAPTPLPKGWICIDGVCFPIGSPQDPRNTPVPTATTAPLPTLPPLPTNAPTQAPATDVPGPTEGPTVIAPTETITPTVTLEPTVPVTPTVGVTSTPPITGTATTVPTEVPTVEPTVDPGATATEPSPSETPTPPGGTPPMPSSTPVPPPTETPVPPPPGPTPTPTPLAL